MGRPAPMTRTWCLGSVASPRPPAALSGPHAWSVGRRTRSTEAVSAAWSSPPRRRRPPTPPRRRPRSSSRPRGRAHRPRGSSVPAVPFPFVFVFEPLKCPSAPFVTHELFPSPKDDLHPLRRRAGTGPICSAPAGVRIPHVGGIAPGAANARDTASRRWCSRPSSCADARSIRRPRSMPASATSWSSSC